MFHSRPFKLVFKVGKRITLNSRPAWAKVWNFVHNVRCSTLVSSCYVVKPCQIIIHNTTVWTRLHNQQPKKMSDELQRTWKWTIFYFVFHVLIFKEGKWKTKFQTMFVFYSTLSSQQFIILFLPDIKDSPSMDSLRKVSSIPVGGGDDAAAL